MKHVQKKKPSKSHGDLCSLDSFSRPLWWLMTATGTVCPAMQQQKAKAFDWQLTLLTIWKWCSDCFFLSPFKRLLLVIRIIIISMIIIRFHGIFCFSVFFWGAIYWCHALWKREQIQKTDYEICIPSINVFGFFWEVESQHRKICFWMAAFFVFWSEDPIWPTHHSERLELVSAVGITSQLRWEKLPGRWHHEISNIMRPLFVCAVLQLSTQTETIQYYPIL